jgi:hypothetical protein
VADIRFEELVLLRCDFEIWPDLAKDAQADPADETEEGEREQYDSEYPAENLLRWKSTASRDGDEFLLLLWARIEAPRLPFRMFFDIGARFATNPQDQTTAEVARPTLIWLAYPFFRELVYNITSRSPLPPYSLPPLTRLPDPALQDSNETQPDDAT